MILWLCGGRLRSLHRHPHPHLTTTLPSRRLQSAKRASLSNLLIIATDATLETALSSSSDLPDGAAVLRITELPEAGGDASLSVALLKWKLLGQVLSAGLGVLTPLRRPSS